MFFHGEIIAAK